MKFESSKPEEGASTEAIISIPPVVTTKLENAIKINNVTEIEDAIAELQQTDSKYEAAVFNSQLGLKTSISNPFTNT